MKKQGSYSVINKCNPVWENWSYCLFKTIEKCWFMYLLCCSSPIVVDNVENFLHALHQFLTFQSSYSTSSQQLNFFCGISKNIQPSDRFNILNYVTFSYSRTRSATAHKLLHNYSSNNKICNFYFNHLPILGNALPPINTSTQSNQ